MPSRKDSLISSRKVDLAFSSSSSDDISESIASSGTSSLGSFLLS
jgi:hypothetical protein